MENLEVIMNQVILIGRLANEPELRYTQDAQTAVCRFTLAVNRIKREDPADFIRITVWGKMAENCDRYLSKGRQVAVNGRIQTGSYTDRDGKKVYTTEVVATNVEFIGGNGDSHGAPQPQAQNQSFGNQPQAQRQSFGNQPQQQSFGSQPQAQPQQQSMTPEYFGYDNFPDSFQRAEDDIPF